MNTSDTGRMHRVLILWLELHQAMSRSDETQSLPWNCRDETVVGLWDQITSPKNARALERWLFQSAEGESADWALKALQVSREREKASNPVT